VQTIIPLGKHGAMRLTTARYYTPSGNSIQATGITPGIIVEQSRVETLEPVSRRREADLRGALENDNGSDTEGSDPAGAETADTDTPQDYQLARAIDLLRGIALFSEMTGQSKL